MVSSQRVLREVQSPDFNAVPAPSPRWGRHTILNKSYAEKRSAFRHPATGTTQPTSMGDGVNQEAECAALFRPTRVMPHAGYADGRSIVKTTPP